ncbi:LUD domain-containing protein [Sorangium sp. So ce381]|uniref:LUD domain-containing protein n=1 Tax=Sorangium sp. So ce381 TaxID=3133307 RepID=UPI003F5B93A5
MARAARGSLPPLARSALGGDPYGVWCTGPSKTADVEGLLIQGVHGPGEPIALIVDAW